MATVIAAGASGTRRGNNAVCAPRREHEGAPAWREEHRTLRCAFNRTDWLSVHCKGGEGRTSTFCAAVRVAQGFDIASAIAEQRLFDFDPEGKHAEQARFLRALSLDVAGGTLALPALPRPVFAHIDGIVSGDHGDRK